MSYTNHIVLIENKWWKTDKKQQQMRILSVFMFLFGRNKCKLDEQRSNGMDEKPWNSELKKICYFQKVEFVTACIDLGPTNASRISLLFGCPFRRSLWFNLSVSFRWHGVQRVRRFFKPQSPPPSATGTIWSACQKSPSLGCWSMRSNAGPDLGSCQLTSHKIFNRSAGCDDKIRRKSAESTRILLWVSREK